MRTIFAIVTISFLSCRTVGAQDRLLTGYLQLPKDARNVAERSQGCEHFAGEINGDGGERDQQVKSAMKKLKCERLEQDAKHIKYKYRNNSKVLHVIDEALEWLAA